VCSLPFLLIAPYHGRCRVEQAHGLESWTALLADPSTPERTLQAFAAKLVQPDSGILSNDETLALFLRTGIEKWCVLGCTSASLNVVWYAD
jgi:hypothetical protein